jgi:hypothetical protein
MTDEMLDLARRNAAEARRDMQQWTGCIAGALTAEHYRQLLESASLTNITLTETHRVPPPCRLGHHPCLQVRGRPRRHRLLPGAPAEIDEVVSVKKCPTALFDGI